MNDWAGTLGELFDTLKARRAIGVFSCISAFGALVAARERPELFDRLVLSQMASYGVMCRWVKTISVGGLITTPGAGQLVSAVGRQLIARKWYTAAVPRGVDPTTFAAPALSSFENGGSFCLASACQTFLGDNANFSGAPQETVLLWGAADPSHRRTDPRSLLEHIPHARVVRCERCGHFPHLESPDVFLRCLDS
jgi:pimeloyl-ACP methyl ester carboxylesterase